MADCAKCGACTVVCPVFRVDGRESLTARGKMHLLALQSAADVSPVFENIFSQCLLCGACEQVCPRHLPITTLVAAARSRFSMFYGQGGLQKVVARSVLARPGLLDGLVRAGVSLKRLQAIPMGSGLRLRLGLLEERRPVQEYLEKKSVSATADINYFSGCLARYLQPSVATATHQLVEKTGKKSFAPPGQCCCGLAAWSAGRPEQAQALAKKNIQAFAGSRGPILTSCASCSSHLLTYPDLFAKDDPWHRKARDFAGRVEEFSAYFGALLNPPATTHPRRVFYHDPCHLRFIENGLTAPRHLLSRMGMQVVASKNGPSCCGQGGLFHIGYPATSEKIFYKMSHGVLAGKPDVITTTCSGCLMQYQLHLAKMRNETKVMHLAVLLVELYPDKCKWQERL